MKRSTAIVVTALLLLVTAGLLFVFVVNLGSSDKAKLRLGDETFTVGDARRLADRTPLLFQDLRGGDLDVWVQHTGSDRLTGWTAFAAHAPGQPRRCQVVWRSASRTFRDRCTNTDYPADGGGLPHYPTSVDEGGKVVVDFAS